MWRGVNGLVGAAAAALLLAGCASQDGFRDLVAVCDRAVTADCGRHSVEVARGERAVVGGREVVADYLLGFVEFDDHGVMVDKGQLETLFRTIETEEGDRDLAVVVYVHGWKHNASPDDPDVERFRDLLRRLHVAEQAGPRQRKVVGVYAAWVGSSLLGRNPASEAAKTLLTFWSRKGAAHRVAEGSIRELFGRARALQLRHNRPCELAAGGAGGAGARCGGDTRLVTIGHSFGALVAYAAVHQQLVDSATRADGDEPIASYGDLVILVNPAIEGVRYESIQSMVEDRRRYARGQAPVLITFASQADWPNRYAFPLGRYLSVLTGLEWPRNLEQAPDVLYALGFVDRFRTHAATVSPGDGRGETTKELSVEAERARGAEQRRAREAFESDFCTADGRPRQGWRRRYADGVVLEHVQHAPENPFWVVSTAPEILPGHNALWRPQFLDLLYQVYTDFVRPDRDLCGQPKAKVPYARQAE